MFFSDLEVALAHPRTAMLTLAARGPTLEGESDVYVRQILWVPALKELKRIMVIDT